jgi:hypothetical protein
MALLAGSPASACYSGLGIIPTTDMIEPGGYGIEIQFDGRLAEGTTDTCLLNTQFGLTSWIELGVDIDLSEESDSRQLLNAKWLLLDGGKSKPGLAFGVCNCAIHSHGSPYLVASRDFGTLRGHLGSMRTNGRNRWFAGIDRAITGRFTLMADFTRGEDQFASVGGSYQFTDHLGVTAAAVFPNTRGQDTGFTVHFVFN